MKTIASSLGPPLPPTHPGNLARMITNFALYPGYADLLYGANAVDGLPDPPSGATLDDVRQWAQDNLPDASLWGDGTDATYSAMKADVDVEDDDRWGLNYKLTITLTPVDTAVPPVVYTYDNYCYLMQQGASGVEINAYHRSDAGDIDGSDVPYIDVEKELYDPNGDADPGVDDTFVRALYNYNRRFVVRLMISIGWSMWFLGIMQTLNALSCANGSQKKGKPLRLA